MSLDVTGLFNAVVSHAAAVGHLEQINQHEPKSAPEGLLTGAVWAQEARPLAGVSGLDSTTFLVTFTLRLYRNMISEPQDAIDPEVLAAADALMGAYSGDFTLSGAVKQVDLLGQHGPGMWARAGYIPQDARLYRVFDVNLPLVVNDLYTQTA